jgi:hypothetical protein
MNSKQKNFLKELDGLMKKYGINEMKGIYEDMPILFNSDRDSLKVKGYYKGKFSDISSYEPEYVLDEDNQQIGGGINEEQANE